MFLAVCMCACFVRPSDMNQVAVFGGIHCMLRIQLLVSTKALFVRIELVCSTF